MEPMLSAHTTDVGPVPEPAGEERRPPTAAKPYACDRHVGPFAAPVPCRLLGGAPKDVRRPQQQLEGEEPVLTNFPYVRHGGLLRIEVFTYSQVAEEPEYAITFDAYLAHISDDDPCWEDSDSFSLFMERSIWHELCPTRFQGLQELPIHRGDFDPPIGCSRFLQETWARGVCVSYVVGWPEGWEVRLPASSSAPSSAPSTLRSPSCSSTRAPASASSTELLPSSPPPSAHEPLP